MTIDEYKDLILEDEINIGYEVEEDDLPEELEDESYIDFIMKFKIFIFFKSHFRVKIHNRKGICLRF